MMLIRSAFMFSSSFCDFCIPFIDGRFSIFVLFFKDFTFFRARGGGKALSFKGFGILFDFSYDSSWFRLFLRCRWSGFQIWILFENTGGYRTAFREGLLNFHFVRTFWKLINKLTFLVDKTSNGFLTFMT